MPLPISSSAPHNEPAAKRVRGSKRSKRSAVANRQFTAMPSSEKKGTAGSQVCEKARGAPLMLNGATNPNLYPIVGASVKRNSEARLRNEC
jgi:hypothetical protein